MIENYFEKDLIFKMRKEKNNKMTPNLEFFRKSNTNFSKILREKHKEDTKLRIFTDQKGTKDMQIRKFKRKTKACN